MIATATPRRRDDCAAGVPRIRDLIASSEEELARRRRRGAAAAAAGPQAAGRATRTTDREGRRDFVPTGEDRAVIRVCDRALVAPLPPRGDDGRRVAGAGAARALVVALNPRCDRCAPPKTRRAVRSASSSIVTARSRRRGAGVDVERSRVDSPHPSVQARQAHSARDTAVDRASPRPGEIRAPESRKGPGPLGRQATPGVRQSCK